MAVFVRRVLGAVAILALAVGLAACTISSDKPLFGDSEGAAPLPDAFTFFPYQDSPNGYVPSGDAPAAFSHEGNAYVATKIPDAKGPLSVTFVPVDDSLFIVCAKTAENPGIVYGFARYDDGVLSIALSPDKETIAAIDHERKSAMPMGKHALRGLAISPSTGAITLKSREALDYLARMYAEGRLPMDKLTVAYIAEDASVAPPSRLVPAGTDWIKVP
jgi:hypothetical protein